MNIGFIGSGNMAQAMISGIISSGSYKPNNIMVSDPNEENLIKTEEKFKILTSKDNKKVAEFADILILAVKPNKYLTVIEGIRENTKTGGIVVTIAAGIPINMVENAFGKQIKIVRTMPNTPAMVGEGMSAISFNEYVNEEEKKEVLNIFESFGKAESIDEIYMDAIPAISSSSPAYVFMFIEALADGAVLSGLPRDKAYKMAAQSVLGSAKMVLETGKHPGELKDMVCSPGGTTIEAVFSLEKNNFRAAIIEAMGSCTKKAKELSKNEN